MTAQVQSSEKQETQILITIQHGNSMLDFENNLQFSLNQAGMLGVEKQLEYMDTDGSPIKVRGVQMTSKSKKEPKVYETSWGAINVSRHIYQSSHGGETFCPLDQSARIIVNSTPAFARMVSWKYAQMAAPQVEEDLRQHHGRKSSRSTLRDLADVVASIAQAKEDKWEYDIPELSKPVATVAIGLDGANLLYYEGYRIAMCGTISLYDDEGERLHTIYCAEAPEYGKQSFINRFTGEIQKVKGFLMLFMLALQMELQRTGHFWFTLEILDLSSADAAEALPTIQERHVWLKQKLHAKRVQRRKELDQATPGNNRVGKN